MTFLVWLAGVIAMAGGLLAVTVNHGLAFALLVLGGALCVTAGNMLTKEPV